MTIQAISNANIQRSLLSSGGTSNPTGSFLGSASPTDILDISSEGQNLASQSQADSPDYSSLASALPTLVSAETTTSLLGTVSLGSSGSSSFYNVLSARSSVSSLSALNASSDSTGSSGLEELDNSAKVKKAADQVKATVSAILTEEDTTETASTEETAATETVDETA